MEHRGGRMTDKKFWQDRAAALMLIVAHAIALFVIARLRFPSDVGLFVLIGLTCSQVSVLSIWTMIGKQSVPLRLAVFLLAMPAIWICIHASSDVSGPTVTQENGVVSGLFMGLQAVSVLMLFRLLQAIKRIFRRPATPAVACAKHNSQFTTRGLFAFMAAVAALLTIGRAVLPHTGWQEVWSNLERFQFIVFLGILCGALAFNSVVIFSAIRLSKHSVLKSIITPILVVIVTVLAIAAIDTMMPTQMSMLASIVLMNVINFLALSISLSVLRRAGWLHESRQLNTEPTP